MGRELPVLFNTDMVRAILEGRKTVTRRIVKDCNISSDQEINENLRGQFEVYNINPRCGIPQGIIFKPPYQTDDIMYVRETWAFIPCIGCNGDYARPSAGINCYDTQAVEYDDGDSISDGCFVYRADCRNPERITWHPSIHMPKEAARIWLKVTDVRVERLQDITNDQILKEGISKETVNHYMTQFPEATEEWVRAAHFLPFSDLWNSTIKNSDIPHYGWNANPWVWAIEFERCGKPENGDCEKEKYEKGSIMEI